MGEYVNFNALNNRDITLFLQGIMSTVTPLHVSLATPKYSGDAVKSWIYENDSIGQNA